VVNFNFLISVQIKLNFIIYETYKYITKFIAPNFNKSRRIRWVRHVASIGEKRGVYRVLVGKPEGKGPLGRDKHKWEDDIKMDIQEVGCGGVDWTVMAQVRDRLRALVNGGLQLRVP
jgi:hypothetical protein